MLSLLISGAIWFFFEISAPSKYSINSCWLQELSQWYFLIQNIQRCFYMSTINLLRNNFMVIQSITHKKNDKQWMFLEIPIASECNYVKKHWYKCFRRELQIVGLLICSNFIFPNNCHWLLVVTPSHSE